MWRLLVFVLAAANALFLAWALWVSPAPGGGVFVMPPVVAPLPEPPPPPRCVSVGPFADAAQASTVARRIADLQLQASLRQERLRQRDGYWVLVATTDAAEQRSTAARLRDAGVQDAYSMPGDPAFRISLGIFSTRERAEQRAQRARPLGLEAVVEEHFQELDVHWVDVPGAGDRISAAQLESLGVSGSEVGAFDCPPAVAAAPGSEPAGVPAL